MSAFESRVSQAVFRARQVERALHDAGPWEISWGPFTVAADRQVSEHAVRFTARMPEHCWLVQPDFPLVLSCRGEEVGVRPVPFPGDGPWEVEWVFGAEVLAPAA